MWVRLTYRQYRMALRVTALDEGMHNALTESTHVNKGTATEVEAPYAAWRYTAMLLRDVAFGPRGGRLSTAGVEFNALKAITKELNFIDKHPALTRAALFGEHPLIIPVWKITPTERDPRLYSPYPMPGREFVVLTPWIQRESGRARLTWWVEKPSGEGRLAHEELHLPLWRQRIR